MNVEVFPRNGHGLIAFDRSTREHLEKRQFSSGGNNGDEDDQEETTREILRRNFITFGGIDADGLLAWLINERSLEIVSTLDGSRRNACEFGRRPYGSTPLTLTELNCATELRSGLMDSQFKLVIGCDDGQSKGVIYEFDTSRNVVTRAIGLPHMVTAVETVSGCVDQTCPISNLRQMCGVVAVGTQSGAVYLVDLKLDELYPRDEEGDVGRLQFIKSCSDIASNRENYLGQNIFLALDLNHTSYVHGEFRYQSTDDNICDIKFSSDAVFVSSLQFLNQANLLAVGFNFGGFQLWNLNTLTLEYSCPCEEHNSLSIVSFAFQEPDNDPRDDSYLWVVRGHCAGDDYIPEDTTKATMYCISFGRKSWIDGLGFSYQELISCLPRFEFDLTLEPSYVRRGIEIMGSRLIRCNTIDERVLNEKGESDNNGSSPSDTDNGGTSLCFFVWETFFVDSARQPTINLAIFDLNQWYLTQMPSTLRVIGADLCPYFGFFSMREICNTAGQGHLLSVGIVARSISRPLALYPSEKLSFPSFLEFDIVAVFTTGLVRASFPGLQGQALDELTRCGSEVLSDPQRAFHLLRHVDLIPLRGESMMPTLTQSAQREVILSIALEKNLMSFLVVCVKDWATGSKVNDVCNLQFIQEWAWKRVAFIKAYIDRQCTVLYDCSGVRLETSVVNCLHSRLVQLKHLDRLFRVMVDCCKNITDRGSKALLSKADVAMLLGMHLDAVLWFHNCNLLPENDDSDKDHFLYSGYILSRNYDQLRAAAQRINNSIGVSDFLLIDGLISNASDEIVSLWKKEEIEANVDSSNDKRRASLLGLYPPPTLHSLLGIFLFDGIPASTKHSIIHYFFFDLAIVLNGGRHAQIVNSLVMYSTSYGLSPSISKITQGFWLLDHKNFEEAISVLLHPMIDSKDISPWQHSRIMKSFLYQGEAEKALRYLRVRKPPHNTPEDRKFHLTLLLASGCISEAYFYQREIRNQTNAEDILDHFFLGCLQTDCFREILQIPFCSFEEKCLESFLLKNPEKKCRDYLVVYFMIRSKYIEAKRLNDQLTYSEKLETDVAIKQRATTRKMLVDGFYQLLPKVQTDMYENISSIFAPGRPAQYVSRPCHPLSTHVRVNAAEPSTSSTFISQVMECVSDLWNRPANDYTNTPIKINERRSKPPLETLPFVRTPLVSHSVATPRLPNVIYPEFKLSSAQLNLKEIGLKSFSDSPLKRRHSLDADIQNATPKRPKIFEDFDREIMSLLQTPTVVRKTCFGRTATPSVNVTPQSILKWPDRTSSPASAIKKRKKDTINISILTNASAVCSSPPITPDNIDETQTAEVSPTIESNYPDQNRDLMSETPVRQLRFQPELKNVIEDSTISSPFNDSPTTSNESFSAVESDSPEKVASQSNLGTESLTSTIGASVDEQLSFTVGQDDDRDGYLTPEESTSETVSSVDTSPLMSALSSPVTIEKRISSSPATTSSPKSNTGETAITTKANKPSITDLKGLTPGDLFKKFVEYRSKMVEEDIASGVCDEETDSPPSLKSLVDTTVESLLSTPTAHDQGPVFVSGIYKCDFPSRRTVLATNSAITLRTESNKIREELDEELSTSTTTEEFYEESISDVDDKFMIIDGLTPIAELLPTKIEMMTELKVETFDKLDSTLVAEQTSPSLSVISTSSRRSTRSSTAMSHVSVESSGMRLRSRNPSNASSCASPESLKKTEPDKDSKKPVLEIKEEEFIKTEHTRSNRRTSLRSKTNDQPSVTPRRGRPPKKSFSFSQPIVADDQDDVAELVKSSPVSTVEDTPFLFSPPLTRSRTRNSISTPTPRTINVKTKQKINKSSSLRSSRTGTPLLSDSVIALMSPIKEKDNSDNDDSSSIQHGMTLRRSKAGIKSSRSSNLK